MSLSREMVATAAVGIAAFGWIFGQAPMPDQTRSAKADRAHSFVQQASNPGDQVAAILHTASIQKAAPLASIELQVPEPAPQLQDNLLQVTASSLKMRTGPSAQTQLVNAYARGATFEKIDQQGQWLQVRSTEDGTSGWMFAEFLQTSN